MSLADFKDLQELPEDDIQTLMVLIDPQGGDFQAITVARLLLFVRNRWMNRNIQKELH